jgi:ankyrin repeat protein
MKTYILILVVIFFIGCINKDAKVKLKGITKFVDGELYNNYSIHDAVRINDIKLVKYFTDNKIDLNKKDRFGYTALHLASRFNHYDIASLLIKNNVLVNTVDKYGDSPLIDSTRNGYSKISKLLICNGADNSVLDKFKMSPLHYASKTNDTKIVRLLKSNDLSNECLNKNEKGLNASSKEQFFNLVSIDDNEVFNISTPKVCGNILDPTVKLIQLSFDNGQSVLNAEILKNRWCVNFKNKLKDGNYTADIIAINSKNQIGKAQDKFSIKTVNSLLNDLKEEFSLDFDIWNAQFEQDTLTIRFKNPELMFARGSTKISNQYRKILDNFFPRYINILKKHESEILKVNIEGHTSSRYRTEKTIKGKNRGNKILSKKRATSILNHLLSIESAIITNNIDFIQRFIVSRGKGSSKLIYNNDGSENYALSRRVEIKIITVQ